MLIAFIAFSSCSRDSVPVEPHKDNGTPVAMTQVVSPLYGATWLPGSTHTIKWSFYHGQQKLDLELYRKTELKMTIATETENDGEYLWRIPNNINLSVHYRIKFINSKDPSTYIWSDYFYIRADGGTYSPY